VGVAGTRVRGEGVVTYRAAMRASAGRDKFFFVRQLNADPMHVKVT